jgi:hypothetical protein
MKQDATVPRARTERFWVAWLQAWQERRYASSCCREMLELRERLVQERPELNGHTLFASIVQRYLGIDPGTAGEILAMAERSYSSWPVERTLTFRDVVHFLIVSYLCMRPGGPGWVLADVRSIVERRIPSHL